MQIRKVSPDVLSHKPAMPRAPSPREIKRRKLESALEVVIRKAAADPDAAFRVTLLADEKLPTVRAAFRRAKARVGADTVNLVTVESDLYIASTPQRRGRQAKGS